MWPKHVKEGGYASYNPINSYICKCTCWSHSS